MPSSISCRRTTRASLQAARNVPDSSAVTFSKSTKSSPSAPAPPTPAQTPVAKRRKVEALSKTTSASSTSTTATSPTLLPASLSFDLSTAISHLSKHDPRFIPLFVHLPCRPFVPPYEPIDPFKTLVTSIIGQQVSWMAARAINGRFRALWGYEEGGFPTAAQVSKGKIEVLKGAGLSTRKAEYVIALAEHFVSGQLSTELLRDGTDEEVAKALIAVRGIGQWTVDMFLIFSLRRPDVLPIGDLGVQKGLLRWALAAHGALPAAKVKPKTKAKAKSASKSQAQTVDQVDEDGKGEIETLIKETTPPPFSAVSNGFPPTPQTPSNANELNPAVLHTPSTPLTISSSSSTSAQLPMTPTSPVPAQTLETPASALPPPTPEYFLTPPDHPHWESLKAVPLDEELTVEVLKARLNGKKVKGGMYLTPKEMEILTEGWKPYRSLGVIYTWSVAEDL